MNYNNCFKQKLLRHQENVKRNPLYQSDFPGMDLRFADLQGLNLKNINLSGCDLSFSNLSGVNFQSANLRAANLSHCQLESACFDLADCTAVNFSDSDIQCASFRGALSEQNLPESKGLTLPLISIYMPTWNREALAIRAITSVINQTYLKWELIIVDDCSPSFAELKKYTDELDDPRVTYIRNTQNTGACAVRNQAIGLAEGLLITGIDDDDEWLPDRLALFVAQHDKLNKHAFLYAGDYICDSDGYLNKSELRVYPKPKYDRRLFDKKNIVGNQMLTLTCRLKSALFDTSLSAAQDYDVFYRLAKSYGDPIRLNEVTQILYVNHGEVRITASSKKFSGYLGFYRKHKESFDSSSKKYQLFTLYYIRNKSMSLHTLLKLCTMRNVKRYVMMYSSFRLKKF